MTRPVTVYRWDDAGAPQISIANYLDFVNVLKKCLVDGYGAKAPLGWTVEYEDAVNNKIVFRNSTINGSGGYVQFWYVNSNTIYMQSATHMTGIDLFVNEGYVNSINLASNFNNAKWIVIGTDTAFYIEVCTPVLVKYNHSSSGSRVYFCGDFISSAINDPSTFISIGACSRSFSSSQTTAIGIGNNSALSGTNLTDTLPFTALSASTSTAMLSIASETDGTPTRLNYCLITLGAAYSYGSTLAPQGGIPLNVVYITESNGAIIPSNPNSPKFRGFMPGLYCLPIRYYADNDYPLQVNINSENYHALRCDRVASGQSGGVAFLLNTEFWESVNRD